MKTSPSRGQDLPPLEFNGDVEVVELHGSFAEAQWHSALERLYRDDFREQRVRGWVDTVRQAL